MRYTVILHKESDGGYVATVPALPGCVSQGDTREEALANIKEAADVYIEDCLVASDPVPEEDEREYVEIRTGTRRAMLEDSGIPFRMQGDETAAHLALVPVLFPSCQFLVPKDREVEARELLESLALPE